MPSASIRIATASRRPPWRGTGIHSPSSQSIKINCSPIIAPRGVVKENSTRNKYFFNVETSSLIRKNINQDIVFIPTLKISSQSDNTSFSLSRSLTFEIDSNLFEIESITKMLVNSSVIQMKKNGLKFTLGDQKYKDQNEKKLMVRINYFNSCESNKIIEIMEKEFPGFIHLEADNMSTPSTSSILYYTNSTIYKIKKWLGLVLNEFNFSANDFFIKSYQSKIDVTKVNKLKYIYVCE